MSPEQVLAKQAAAFREQALAQGKNVIDVYPGDPEPTYPVPVNTLVIYHVKPRPQSAQAG